MDVHTVTMRNVIGFKDKNKTKHTLNEEEHERV